MQMHPNKDTQLCMSLSARPGNFGLRFHNHLYEQLGLNFYYKAFSSQDLPGAIGGIRALGVRGCGVSMPFKEAAIALVDELDDSVQAIDSLNTIVNTNGHLKAYNTDYIAIEQLLKKHSVPKDSTFALRGSGGMAKAVASALRDGGYANGVIVARNEAAGQALARNLGYEWQADLGDLRPQFCPCQACSSCTSRSSSAAIRASSSSIRSSETPLAAPRSTGLPRAATIVSISAGSPNAWV